MNSLCMALQPELEDWLKACTALAIVLAGDVAPTRAAAADSFSLVARSMAALAGKHSWVTREGREGGEGGAVRELPPDDFAAK